MLLMQPMQSTAQIFAVLQRLGSQLVHLPLGGFLTRAQRIQRQAHLMLVVLQFGHVLMERISLLDGTGGVLGRLL